MIYLVGLIFILQFTSLIYEKGDFPPHVSSVTITGPPLLLSWFEYHTARRGLRGKERYARQGEVCKARRGVQGKERSVRQGEVCEERRGS